MTKTFEEHMERLERKPRYFDRKSNQLELLEWARLFEDKEYQIVKQDMIGKYFVSTVWIGHNMAFWNDLPILIFETMIFIKGERKDDPLEGYQERYTTEEQALEGHEKAIKLAKGELSL